MYARYALFFAFLSIVTCAKAQLFFPPPESIHTKIPLEFTTIRTEQVSTNRYRIGKSKVSTSSLSNGSLRIVERDEYNRKTLQTTTIHKQSFEIVSGSTRLVATSTIPFGAPALGKKITYRIEGFRGWLDSIYEEKIFEGNGELQMILPETFPTFSDSKCLTPQVIMQNKMFLQYSHAAIKVSIVKHSFLTDGFMLLGWQDDSAIKTQNGESTQSQRIDILHTCSFI